jgi:hypothetical protein
MGELDRRTGRRPPRRAAARPLRPPTHGHLRPFGPQSSEEFRANRTEPLIAALEAAAPAGISELHVSALVLPSAARSAARRRASASGASGSMPASSQHRLRRDSRSAMGAGVSLRSHRSVGQLCGGLSSCARTVDHGRTV